MASNGDVMSCLEAIRQLDLYLDRELAPAERERVAVHLARCADCASHFRRDQRFIREIKARLGRGLVPGLLVRRIAKLLDDELNQGDRAAGNSATSPRVRPNDDS